MSSGQVPLRRMPYGWRPTNSEGSSSNASSSPVSDRSSAPAGFGARAATKSDTVVSSSSGAPHDSEFPSLYIFSPKERRPQEKETPDPPMPGTVVKSWATVSKAVLVPQPKPVKTSAETKRSRAAEQELRSDDEDFYGDSDEDVY
jgi:hypothetical protein